MRRKEIRMTVFCLPISLFSHSLSSFPFLSFPVFSFFFSLLAVWDMLLNCEKITHHPEPEGRGNLVGVFPWQFFPFPFYVFSSFPRFLLLLEVCLVGVVLCSLSFFLGGLTTCF